jgi:hypothetical protein
LTGWVRDFAELLQVLLFELPWVWRVEKEVIEKPRSVDLLFGCLDTKTRSVSETRRRTIFRLEEST